MFLFRFSNPITILILTNFVVLFIAQILAKESTKRVKSIYEYDFERTEPKTTSAFSGRMDQDAIDLYKEYKDSIYVDRYYNSSFALNIPLFTITLPGRGRGVHSMNSVTTFNIGYSIVLAGLILLGIALYAPVIFPESRRGFEKAMDMKSMNKFVVKQMDDFSEHVFGRKLESEERNSIFKTLEKQFGVLSTNIIHSMHESIEDLPHFPAKRFQECIKWCICDAHRRPRNYGYLGKLFRSIFPHKTSDESLGKSKSKVLSHYQMPAKHGRDGKVSCDDKYDDCSISIVEVIQEFNFLATNQFKRSDLDKSFILKVLEYYFQF